MGESEAECPNLKQNAWLSLKAGDPTDLNTSQQSNKALAFMIYYIAISII